jgi:benzoate-CoA ligase family protein
MPVSFPKTFNMATYFLDHNIDQGRGSRVAVRCRDTSYTYADVVDMVNRTGNVLLSLGIEIEDRILIVLPDTMEFVAAWFAIAKIGAVIAMANTVLPAADYEYYLEYTRTKAAFVDASVMERFSIAASSSRYLKHILVVGAKDTQPTQINRVSVASFEAQITRASGRLEAAPTSRDDIAIWLFTSGSTGHPKAAVHLHHDLPYNTECYAKQVLAINEDDITLSVPKLFFGYATGTNLLFPFAVGGSTALFSERSTATTMFEMIERYRPTILTTVPTMINAMLQVEGAAARYDLSSLRACVSAGEALPPELYNRWMDTFGAEILDGIGSAEMFHIYISNRPSHARPGSLGQIVPGYEASVVGPDGKDVAPGELGTLRIKGDSAALCYWNAHEESKETFQGDWCTTGDLVRLDDEGYFWYGGRRDEMLKVGGVYVSPAEIENCLLQHLLVLECAVVGESDDQGLVKSKAFIVLAEGAQPGPALENELKEFVKSRLAPYKYPRAVEFRHELPKNDRGKIDRKALRTTVGL